MMESKMLPLSFHLWISRESQFAFWFDKQSHVSEIIDIWHRNQAQRLSEFVAYLFLGVGQVI